MKELKDHIDDIITLCNANNVKSLFAFDSVVSDHLSAESDNDLIVDIKAIDPIEYSYNYFAIKFQLETILNRKIDLLETKALKNPFSK